MNDTIFPLILADVTDSLLDGFAILILIAGGLFLLWSTVWSAGDASQRGKSGCLVAMLVALVWLPIPIPTGDDVHFLWWPAGLLIWFVARPPFRDNPPDGPSSQDREP